MPRRLVASMVLVASLGSSTALLRAQPPAAAPAPLDPRIAVWDNGPQKIDVSKYPAAMKEKYKVFADVCSRCHPLGRGINVDFVLPEDWERYIKRMMRRGKGLVTPADAAQIYEFLIFDSRIRKSDLYEQRMAAAK
ncbi:MAG TPA: hypothetical protein VFA27_04160 [Vicinamibacterales bacterium]|nr:hypothetical protein [Vicinamibacterales bacterium]